MTWFKIAFTESEVMEGALDRCQNALFQELDGIYPGDLPRDAASYTGWEEGFFAMVYLSPSMAALLPHLDAPAENVARRSPRSSIRGTSTFSTTRE